ncbi:MAG TPA: hypothetical protein VMR17_08430, partial [Xanthobacteraceae bacterium]|nr:hypothetical protein [Xanthobacteraceae bacterium]
MCVKCTGDDRLIVLEISVPVRGQKSVEQTEELFEVLLFDEIDHSPDIFFFRTLFSCIQENVLHAIGENQKSDDAIRLDRIAFKPGQGLRIGEITHSERGTVETAK